MLDGKRPERLILRTRIRFALRRATGVVFDIDAMLRKPELRASRIRIWREVGSDELSSLLDQLESELQADGALADDVRDEPSGLPPLHPAARTGQLAGVLGRLPAA